MWPRMSSDYIQSLDDWYIHDYGDQYMFCSNIDLDAVLAEYLEAYDYDPSREYVIFDDAYDNKCNLLLYLNALCVVKEG
jgi:hypothetical protein